MKKLFAILSCIFILACSNNINNKEVIKVTVGAEPQSIDPSYLSAIDSMIYAVHVFEGLVTKDKEGNIVGGVAESWKFLLMV